MGAVAVAAVMVFAACGSADDQTVVEPDVEVDADDDGALRLAGGGVQVINGCRIAPGTRCQSVNLSGANLEGANLENAQLDSANLQGANLRGANLENANLRYGNLRGTNLQDANLRRSNLYSVDLTDANLLRANVERSNLSGARFCRTLMPGNWVRSDSWIQTCR